MLEVGSGSSSSTTSKAVPVPLPYSHGPHWAGQDQDPFSGDHVPCWPSLCPHAAAWSAWPFLSSSFPAVCRRLGSPSAPGVARKDCTDNTWHVVVIVVVVFAVFNFDVVKRSARAEGVHRPEAEVGSRR